MKKIFLALVTILLTAPTVQTVSAQDPSEIAKGAGLWANNCTRCHNARSPMERNDRSWVTVVNHMRARANLTKSEARAIAAYLQAINTPESNTAISERGDQIKTDEARVSQASASRDLLPVRTIIRAPDEPELSVDELGDLETFLRSHAAHQRYR